MQKRFWVDLMLAPKRALRQVSLVVEILALVALAEIAPVRISLQLKIKLKSEAGKKPLGVILFFSGMKFRNPRLASFVVSLLPHVRK